MNHIILFMSLIICTFSNKVSRYKGEPIISGAPSSIVKFPYYASIIKFDYSIFSWHPICGATILSAYWLVSASHCFSSSSSFHSYKIRTGYDEYYSMIRAHTAHLHMIEMIEMYPNYEYMYNLVSHNDICLIKVPYKIELKRNKQWPIALPSLRWLKIGLKPKIVGLGSRSASDMIVPSELYFCKVKIMSRNLCPLRLVDKAISKKMFCALPVNNCYPAQGDSGGPAVLHSKLVGIIISVSYQFHPPSFTFTSIYHYTDWIFNVTGIRNILPAPVDGLRCLSQKCGH